MENVCRTCLRVPNQLLPLYSDENLINKIETISSIQLVKSSTYPSTICQECVTNVNKLYNFRKVIINSDKELRDRNATWERLKIDQTSSKENSFELNNTSSDEIKIDADTKLIDSTVFDNVSSPKSDSDMDKPKLIDHIKDSVKKAIAVMRLYKCTICNKTFPSRFKLYNHRRTDHMAPGICNICGMTVRSDNLRRHVQLHVESPVECKHCGKVCKNSESLRGHMLIHKGLIFTCEICGKTSKVKAEHKRHMRTHLDPEMGKIMCTICGKRVRDMKKHMHSHTGERPYMCTYCSKGFTSPYALKVHTRQHTNEKPYVCEHCPMAFHQKVSLVTHVKSKHNNNDQSVSS